MQNRELEVNLLTSLFMEFNDSKIDYCILRNYDGLPDINESKDVDILIDYNSIAKAKNILLKVARSAGAIMLDHAHFQAIDCYKFYSSDLGLAKVDYFYNFESRGARYLRGRDILAKKRKYKGFFVVDEVHEAVISWLKPLITGSVVKLKYSNHIIAVARDQTEIFRDNLIKIIGKSLADKSLSIIIEGDLQGTNALAKRIKTTAWLKSLFREPIYVISNLFNHIIIEIKRQILIPKKKMIVVIGPDGSGKSTIIKALTKVIPEVYREDQEKVRVFHFRPSLIPNLKVLLTFGKNKDSDEAFNNPHRAEPSGALGSLIRLIYYYLDYIVGYFLKVRPLFAKNYLVIFDRYYYDFIVDSARSRIRLPKFIPILLMKLVPRPSLTIFLDNDEETIYDRKQELSKKEISRQLKDYRTLASKHDWFYTVDSRKPINDIASDISSAYISHIAKPLE